MKTASVILGDGKEYMIGAFNVGDFIEIEKKYGSIQLDSNKMEPIIYWLWLALRKYSKEMKLEDLYELIDAPFIAEGGINKMFDALSKLNGWETQNEKNAVSPAEKD